MGVAGGGTFFHGHKILVRVDELLRVILVGVCGPNAAGPDLPGWFRYLGTAFQGILAADIRPPFFVYPRPDTRSEPSKPDRSERAVGEDTPG